jgi:DNA-binding transcriptional LysR family regulator
MVLVPRGLSALKPAPGEIVECWTIEERSLTWAALAGRLRRRDRPWGLDLRVTGRLESFTALARLAAAGFAHALVPRGVALAAGAPSRVLVPLPGLQRPIALLSRRTALERRAIAAFADALARAWPRQA